MSTQETDVKKGKQGQIECTVTFTEADVAPAEKMAMETLGSTLKLKGFRPGQAPTEMMRSQIPQDQLMEETIRNLLPSTFERLVKENDIQPIIAPRVEAVSTMPLKLKVVFIEKPEVKIKGADKISVKKEEPKFDEKDIDRMVDYVLQQHQETKEVERPAEEGDRVTMDFWGEGAEGKEIPEIRSNDYQVIIGSKTLLPGFEENLKKHSKGDEVSFQITFPEKYHAEHLQNAPVTFHVTLKKIEEVKTPELTDAFAKKELQAESVADFRSKIEESMRKQEEGIDLKKREQQFFDEVRKVTTVDLAPELIEDETRLIIDELQQQLQQQNSTLEEWLQKNGKKPEEMQKEMEKRAIERLTLRLGMQKLIDEKDIDISDEEMTEAIEGMFSAVPEEQQAQLLPAYKKGSQAYEQLKWQKKVETVMKSYLEA